MSRYSAGVLTAAGSTTLPIIAVVGSANGGGALRQVNLGNTGSSSVVLKLVRLSTAGTPGSSLTIGKTDPKSGASRCTAYGTYTGTGPTITELGPRWLVPAGGTIIDTFGDAGVGFTASTTDGVGVVVASGTGQACEASLTWDE